MWEILDIKNKIITKYRIYCFLINNENRCWFTDNNRYAQDFFVELWNLLWWYSLENADYIKNANQDTYDLIDKKSKLLIQVTSQKDIWKIRKTLNSFKSSYEWQFDKIKIWIIWEKGKYRINFDMYSDFFDKDKDIIDIKTISNKIMSISDTSKLWKISTIVDNYFQLNEKPIEFNTIEDVLNHLKSVLIKNSLYKGKEKLSIDNGRINNPWLFISKKDSINWIEKPFYENNAIYWNDLEEFLKYSDEYRSIYNSISFSINYIIEKKWLIDTLTMFRNEIPFWDSKLTEALYIILSNMYFNCDIWKNPDDINW